MTEAKFSRVESERLVLRRFEDRDLAPFLDYRNDPEVARYQGWGSMSEREARDIVWQLERAQPGTPGDWFQFAIELKDGTTSSGTAP